MKSITYTKLLLLLFLFLFLDILRPGGFYLAAELLFIGILVISIEVPLFYAFTMSALCGAVKDFVCVRFPFYVVCFVVITFFVKYSFKHLHPKKLLTLLIVAVSIVGYALLNSLESNTIEGSFLIVFFVQTLTLFYVIHYFTHAWVSDLSEIQ